MSIFWYITFFLFILGMSMNTKGVEEFKFLFSLFSHGPEGAFNIFLFFGRQVLLIILKVFLNMSFIIVKALIHYL